MNIVLVNDFAHVNGGVALCGMPGALMEIDPQGRFATVRVAPRTVQIIDVPAGQPLAMKELS